LHQQQKYPHKRFLHTPGRRSSLGSDDFSKHFSSCCCCYLCRSMSCCCVWCQSQYWHQAWQQLHYGHLWVQGAMLPSRHQQLAAHGLLFAMIMCVVGCCVVLSKSRFRNLNFQYAG
jgi:hypothetical protein